METHRAVFGWVLELLAEKGLLKGKTVGIDATTLEANAAMRSIVRRDTGEGYEEFLRRLAEESGIATPTREQLAKLDRKRGGHRCVAIRAKPITDGRVFADVGFDLLFDRAR